jgi:hypothetical protein
MVSYQENVYRLVQRQVMFMDWLDNARTKPRKQEKAHQKTMEEWEGGTSNWKHR